MKKLLHNILQILLGGLSVVAAMFILAPVLMPDIILDSARRTVWLIFIIVLLVLALIKKQQKKDGVNAEKSRIEIDKEKLGL